MGTPVGDLAGDVRTGLLRDRDDCRVDEPVRPVDDAPEVCAPQLGGRGPRVDALQEQRLGTPQGAETGEVALVEQGCADGRVGVHQVRDGLLRITVPKSPSAKPKQIAVKAA